MWLGVGAPAPQPDRRTHYVTARPIIARRAERGPTSLAVFMNTPFGYYGLFPGQDISLAIGGGIANEIGCGSSRFCIFQSQNPDSTRLR